MPTLPAWSIFLCCFHRIISFLPSVFCAKFCTIILPTVIHSELCTNVLLPSLISSQLSTLFLASFIVTGFVFPTELILQSFFCSKLASLLF